MSAGTGADDSVFQAETPATEDAFFNVRTIEPKLPTNSAATLLSPSSAYVYKACIIVLKDSTTPSKVDQRTPFCPACCAIHVVRTVLKLVNLGCENVGTKKDTFSPLIVFSTCVTSAAKCSNCISPVFVPVHDNKHCWLVSLYHVVQVI